MKYELKQSIYNTAHTCCRWLGTGDITPWPVTLTVCYTVHWAKKPTKLRTVRWREKGETPRSSQEMSVTLHKLFRWLSFHLHSHMLTPHPAASAGSPRMGSTRVPSEIRSTTRLFWGSVENSWVQCFLWQLNRCAVPEQPPQMTFSYYTPKALSSTVWLLADSCCKCRVLSCSSCLPSNCISQTHLKATSSPIVFHYFFLPNLSLCNFSYLILVKPTDSFWMLFNKSHK